MPGITLTLLTWRIWWAPNTASRWHVAFNSAFEGLNCLTLKMKTLSTFGISITVYQFMRHKYPRRRKYSVQYMCELAIFALWMLSFSWDLHVCARIGLVCLWRASRVVRALITVLYGLTGCLHFSICKKGWRMSTPVYSYLHLFLFSAEWIPQCRYLLPSLLLLCTKIWAHIQPVIARQYEYMLIGFTLTA